MDRAAKERLGILKIFAELDKSYTQLVHIAYRAETELLKLKHHFTPDELEVIWSVIHAREDVNQRFIQLACENMIFEAELAPDFLEQ